MHTESNDLPVADAASLVEAARATEMSPEGIIDLSRRLQHGATDLARSAVSAALEADEVYVATLIAMAAANAQIVIRPVDVRRLLPAIPSPPLLPVVVGLVTGDRLRLVVDVTEDPILGFEAEATLLAIAALLLDGYPAPPPLVARIRTLARRDLPFVTGLLVGLAADCSGDADAARLAERWIQGTAPMRAQLREEIASKLRGPVIAALPRMARLQSAGPAPRTVSKIGRNDPCPCGSGKKYKKCCAGKPDANGAEPGAEPEAKLPTAGQLDKARAPEDPTDVDRMGPATLARADFRAMPTKTLLGALRRLTTFHQWEAAARAMDELATRKDTPMRCDADGYREELIWEAIEAEARDVVRDQVDRLQEQEAKERLAIKLAVFDPSSNSLAKLDGFARSGLKSPRPDDVIELAYSLLEKFPGLGILVARGALDPDREIDSDFLLRRIEEARDELGLPPGDISGDAYDALLDRKAEDDEVQQIKSKVDTEREQGSREREEMRRELRESARGMADLQRQLAEAQTRSGPEGRGRAPDDDDPEVRERLRSKVEELKQRVADGQAERAELRRRLEQALADRTRAADRGDRKPAPDVTSEVEAQLEAPVRQKLRVPLFNERARAALSSVPKPVAAQAIRMAGELGAGDDTVWSSVKRLQGVAGVFAVRIGIHHRLLFRLPPDEAVLDIVAVVTREDLLTTIKSFK